MFKLISALFIFSLVFSSCAKQPIKDSEKLPNGQTELQKEVPKLQKTSNSCLCPQMWLPVCGVNGRTYSNSCYAKCAGIEFKQGSCEDISAE